MADANLQPYILKSVVLKDVEPDVRCRPYGAAGA